jgi:hypothetical protein
VKGVAATMLRLLYVSRLQLWLFAAGMGAVALATGAMVRGWVPDARPLFGLAAALGIVTAVIAPCVTGPILFQSLYTPRAIALIPHGRLKLVVGALCSQLVVAALAGGGLGLLHARSGLQPGAPLIDTLAQAGAGFVIAFCALTAFFMIFSWVIQYRLGAVIWLPFIMVPRMLAILFPGFDFGHWIGSAAGVGRLRPDHHPVQNAQALDLQYRRPANLGQFTARGARAIPRQTCRVHAA